MNKISIIKSGDGWITIEEQVKQYITDYFRSLILILRSRDFLQNLEVVKPSVSDSMNASPCKPWLNEAIREATFQLSELKAPGPDRFSRTFYFKNWNIVGESMCKTAKSFFQCRFLLKEINQTFITLIPSVSKPSEVSRFLPISLCNFIYKVIAKCLVNRIKPIFKEINQAAFVPE